MQHANLSADTLDRLQFAGAHIARAWALLQDTGFSLTRFHFNVLESLRRDDEGLKSPEVFYEECVRELFSCELGAWHLLDRPREGCRYRSEYLDRIEANYKGGAWQDVLALGGRATPRQDPAVARYTRLKFAASAAAERYRDWKTILRAIDAIKDREAQAIAAVPETSTPPAAAAGRSARAIRALLDPLFAASGLEYDRGRSKRSCVTYTRRIDGGPDVLACSVEKVNGAWSTALGVIGEDAATPLLGNDVGLPLVFDFDQVYPGTRWYLVHEERPPWLVLGAAFMAAATRILGDLLEGDAT